MAKSPRLAEQPRVVLPGSEKAPVQTDVPHKPTPPRTKITVSVILRRKNPLKINNRAGRTAGPVRVTRAEYKKHHAADPADISLVRAFARDHNLKVEPDPTAAARRTLQLTGTAADMQKAFSVELNQKTVGGTEYRVREGSIQIPAALAGPVVAVLGLDNRPQALPHFRIRKSSAEPNITAHAVNVSYTPVQVAQAYQFPTTASGAGQTIGIIELGGGYRQTDLTAYFKTLNQSAPAITAVAVDGGKNSPSNANGADGEVMLDIEVAAAVAPGAKIAVYFCPNTDQGFIDAITTAVHDATNKPSVISISWGGPESSWTQQSMTALDAACQSAAALGVTITVAAGDNGSSDGVTDGANHVDFPASSPHVLACGGTTLEATGSTITSETVWNETANNEGATGGGVSTVFPQPTWQASASAPIPPPSTPGRGVPDVSGDADPATGYTIRVDGQTTVIGGTSAVAPLWAGLIAVANQQLGLTYGKTIGFLNPTLYATRTAIGFRDVTEGNNGTYQAGPGWDACTGLGSPIASKLIPLLAPVSAPPTPSTTPTPPVKQPKKPTKPKKKPTKTVTKKAAKKVAKEVTGKTSKKAAKKTA
jgi:kumamolisin